MGPGPLSPLDELDLVAVGVLDEGDDAAAVLHGPGRSGNRHAFPFQRLAGGMDVLHGDGEMLPSAAG